MAQAAENAEPEKKSRKKTLTKAEKKKKRIRNIAIGVGAFIALIVWYGTLPIKGSIDVGLCRTFAELQLRYPRTMRLTTVDVFQDSTRIYYTYMGPYGENRSSLIDCRSAPDPVTGQPTFYAIKIDRNDMPQDALDKFNRTIPFILQHNPDLVIPRPYSGDLYDLKRD